MSEVDESSSTEPAVQAETTQTLSKKGSFLSFFASVAKPVAAQSKTHGNQRRATMSSVMQQSIDAGAVSMRRIVQCPPGEDEKEWVAANVLDFFNSVSLFWSLIAVEAKEEYNRPGLGFPRGFEYSPADLSSRQSVRGGGAGGEKRASAPEYVSLVLDWIEAQFDDARIFPTCAAVAFPLDFVSHYVREICIRIFRVYAIMYNCCLDMVKRQRALAHMNTSFKHFFFFAVCQNRLVDKAELAALKSLSARLADDFADAKE